MRIICPACGVNMMLPEDEPGDVVECAGCGKRIRVFRREAKPNADHMAFAPPPPVATARPLKKSSGRSNGKSKLIAGLVGVGAAVVLIGVAVVVYKEMAPAKSQVVEIATASVPATEPIAWDQLHRADLLALQATADGLARDGKWQPSYDAYQQILTFIGDHEVKDPVALSVIESVRSGEDRAMSAIVASRVAAITPPAPGGANAATMPVALSQTFSDNEKSATTQATAERIGETASTAVAPAATQPTTAPLTPADLTRLAADTAPPLGGPAPPPPSLHAYTLPDAMTDEQIGQAINQGVKYLAAQFTAGEVNTGLTGGLGPARNFPNNRPRFNSPLNNAASNLDTPSNLGNLPPPGSQIPPAPNFAAPWSSAYSTPGIDALCVYALLNAGRAMDVPGLAANDPFTVQILEQLKRYNMVFTYHRSLRAAALAVFNRTEDNAALEEDVRWLLQASMQGGYTYTMPPNGVTMAMYDNSNSQYGLLGVWSGALAGKAIAQQYWLEVEQHWNGCALAEGTWGYTKNAPATTTMTCAGIASLLVAREFIDSNTMTGAGNRASQSPILEAGLNWLDTGDNCMTNMSGDGMGGAGYGLYGLERVGLASGYKYFGTHDWYSELAKRLVLEQHPDGSWGSPGVPGLLAANARSQAQTLVDTAYALLFLARGRHPILFNKLRYDGPWNNRPHDAAHLARYAGNQLERPLNWQVVNLRRNWFDWMDCPVLYIAGDKKLKLTPQDYLALRDFAYGGGTIFTHADGGSSEFNKWVVDLAHQIFPKYEMMPVPRNHSMYSTVYNLKNPPPMTAVSNGSRLLLIHSPTDLAGGWQVNWTDEKKLDFQMGTNLFVYAAGKGNLKNRLQSTYIPEDPDKPDSTQQIARLQYPSEWDPEPYAWTRFSRFFQWETHQAIEPVVVQMKSLMPGSQPMAVLTGTVRHDFTESETAAVQAYVQAGGILVIDACGGQPAFVKSIETTLLPQAFPGATPTPIAANHPLLLPSRAHADDLRHPIIRGYAIENGGKDLPIETIAFGKGWVIFSRLDLTTGLLGTQSWGIKGFDPAYSQALMKNAVLWAEARSPATTQPAQ